MDWAGLRGMLCALQNTAGVWTDVWGHKSVGLLTGYLHPKTVHDKVKPLCTKFTEMSQHGSKSVFLPSYVYLYVSSCDKMYKDVKDWTCQMQDLLLSILRMSYKEINTMYGVCSCVYFIAPLYIIPACVTLQASVFRYIKIH